MTSLKYLGFLICASLGVMGVAGENPSILTDGYCVGQKTIGFLSGWQEDFTYHYFLRAHPDKIFSVKGEAKNCSAKWGCDYSFGPGAAISQGDQDSLTIKGETCRQEPTGTDFVCATKRRMIYAGSKADVFYTTFDHKEKDFLKNSLSLLAGTLRSDGPQKILATFKNDGFIYELHTSVAKNSTSLVIVSKDGTKISEEDCEFFSLSQSFVDHAFPEFPFKPTGTQAITLVNGQVLFIGLENAALLEPKTMQWKPIENAPESLGIGGNFYALPDGRAISLGPAYRLFDPKSLKWSEATPLDPKWYGWGSSVQLQDHRIMKILVAKINSKDGHPFKGPRYYAFFDPNTLTWSEPTKFTISVDEEDNPDLGLLESGQVFMILTAPKAGFTRSSLFRPLDGEYKISVYDPSSKIWSSPQVMPFNLTAKLSWIPTGSDDLLFVGAQRKSGSNDEILSSIIFNGRTKSIMPRPVPEFFTPKTGLSLFKAHGSVFALVSKFGDELPKQFMERLDSGKRDWRPVQGPKIARLAPFLFELPDKKILVMGPPDKPNTILEFPPDRFEILDAN